MDIQVLGPIITGIIMALLGVWKYKDEKKKRDLEIEKLSLENRKLRKENVEKYRKLNFYDEILKLVFYNNIDDAVQRIFETTKADRFLVLIARNGEADPRFVDVILDWYKNKEQKIDAVKIYKDVPIDDPYVRMLHKTFHFGFADIETAVMEEQILKHYYKTEKVMHSRTNRIDKKYFGENKALLIYTSTSTHNPSPFTPEEKSTIDLYNNGMIKNSIKAMLHEK